MADVVIRVEGGEVHIAVDGDEAAPLVLFAHPFTLDGGCWEDLRSACVRAGLRAAAVDAPGFGRSTPRGKPLTMDALAALFAASLDALSVERAALVGCSMGGYAGLAFAQLYPERLAAAVLMCTRATADSPESRARREAQAATALAKGAQEVIAPLLPTFLAPGAALAAPAVLAKLVALAAGATAQGTADALRGMALRPDSTAALSRIRANVLVVAAEHDQLIPRADMEALAAGLPHARLEVIPKAGHLPFLETPREVERMVVPFLTRELAVKR